MTFTQNIHCQANGINLQYVLQVSSDNESSLEEYISSEDDSEVLIYIKWPYIICLNGTGPGRIQGQRHKCREKRDWQMDQESERHKNSDTEKRRKGTPIPNLSLMSLCSFELTGKRFYQSTCKNSLLWKCVRHTWKGITIGDWYCGKCRKADRNPSLPFLFPTDT